jgi:hypothetical protein
MFGGRQYKFFDIWALTFDIKNILLISGLVIYVINYTIGWLLHFKIITMTKRTHQDFFASIIVNLLALLFYLNFMSPEFILCLSSLLMMLVLPFGIKGGVYHRIVSTAGLILYLIFFID